MPIVQASTRFSGLRLWSVVALFLVAVFVIVDSIDRRERRASTPVPVFEDDLDAMAWIEIRANTTRPTVVVDKYWNEWKARRGSR